MMNFILETEKQKKFQICFQREVVEMGIYII